MAKKKVTIKEVAKYSGVSITTVSKILNGKKESFSADTIQKVLAAKEKLGYQPDYVAQRMVMKKSKTIGVIVPDITNPFFAQLLQGIEEVCYQENYILMLCNIGQNTPREYAYLTELIRRQVDGIIIASSEISNQTINETLKTQKIPYIVLDQKKATGYTDAVLSDDYQGGMLAAQALQQKKHQQVAIVTVKHAPLNIQKRVAGFCSVYEDPILIETELSKKGGQIAATAIVKQNITAIFAVSDEIAFGLYRGLNQLNKNIPTDYSIVGYDDVEMSAYVFPPLTTIAQPIRQLGQTAAELLLARIKQPTKIWEEKMLPVRLIERASIKFLK